jgi:glycerol-3-phosphate O-acyltransferase
MIKKGLAYLKDFIESKREILEPLVSAKQGEKSILMLSYYRNNLTHVFINEAEISCTLLGFSISKDSNSGYSLDEAWKRTQFLKNLLNEEFVLRDTMKTIEEFKNVLQFMSKRKFIQLEGDTIKVDLKEEI